jgi:hypothetical protein
MPIIYHPPYAAEASADSAHQYETEFAIFYALNLTMRDGLRGLCDLVDLAHAGAHLGGEPGWSIDRQKEPGEERRYVARLRVQFANAKPKPPVWREPGPEEGPDLSWPEGSRYKVELNEPAEFGDPKYPLIYYDALTFEGFLKKILAVYVKYNPESAEQVEEILAHAHYWVELDAKARSNRNE